ncbi:MAG: diaminopimelate epimerase [Abitibacteriaceae bacterium]|nr:diaminopimelate epimerase [Abditibacteriaceae bacterium]MBV9866758.1 diaminopimelate epimerase [Abditibacteriaceae bacterium]
MTALFSTPFIKMQGAGNDFIVLDALSHPFPDNFDFSAAALAWCDRHYGIGSDGLLLLATPEAPVRTAGAVIRMRMWNPDGSEDMCGNGLRCIVHLANRRGHVKDSQFIVQTWAGLRTVEVLTRDKIRVAMGLPDFNPATIPLQLPPAQAATRGMEYMLEVGGRHIPHVTTFSTGSTHTVIFVPTLPDDEPFGHLSPLIEHHAWFPERTSIMWTQVVNEHQLKLRIWERGAGETLACGTGASAAAVAAQITERCGRGVDVQSRGGTLHIEWQPGTEILMAGPAQVVFEGEIAAKDGDYRG